MVLLESGREQFLEATPEDVGMSTARLGNVTQLVQRYIDDEKFPGAISLVARRGKVVHFETYGEMDHERSLPMRADAIFRFYSMTKPIASVALMTLYEQGRLLLEDPASRFIPELKGLKVFVDGTADNYTVREPAREMTIRDLSCTRPVWWRATRSRRSASCTDAITSAVPNPAARSPT
jgi:CubicO group peptidase (beta-lactamase class C family)